jgi:hypothetical protein
MELLFSALAFSTAALQVATVVFLFLGTIRKYAFVLAYCLLQLATSVVEMTVALKFGPRSRQFFELFWTDEIVLDVLLFFILILLTYRAMEGSTAQGHVRRLLGGVMLMAMLLPFVLFKGAFVTMAWFDHTSQLLNFGGAILNLGLWDRAAGVAEEGSTTADSERRVRRGGHGSGDFVRMPAAESPFFGRLAQSGIDGGGSGVRASAPDRSLDSLLGIPACETFAE